MITDILKNNDDHNNSYRSEIHRIIQTMQQNIDSSGLQTDKETYSFQYNNIPILSNNHNNNNDGSNYHSHKTLSLHNFKNDKIVKNLENTIIEKLSSK